MGLPEIVQVARNFSVMVRVQGPDPKGLKMRRHAFHHYISGKTTLSASGMVLPSSCFVGPLAMQARDEQMSLVLTVASVIEPFLSSKYRDHLSQAKPELISGVQIDVMVEGDGKDSENGTLRWLPAELITLVETSASSVAVQSLIGASSGSLEHGWEVGWSLASYNDGHLSYIGSTRKEGQQLTGAESISSTLMGKLATQIAILKVSSRTFQDLPNLNVSPRCRRGDLLLAMGAPFGVLSPVHFCNSISVGFIANCYPPNSSHLSLLMADMRCLPGMEGSPVFGEHSELVGMLTRPLRQRGSGAEVQLVIPWEAIVTACSDLLLPNEIDGKETFRGVEELPSSLASESPIENAISSICLITMDSGVWASGVVLNKDGLVLTNAHLLEPWRFRKTEGHRNHKPISELLFNKTIEIGDYLPAKQWSKQCTFDEVQCGNESKINRRIHQRIQVRLDYSGRWIWCDARVLYVSKGPLDVALLQLEFVPDKLNPIVVDFTCPSPGSKAYVVGHGLFAPRRDLLPSACVGVVAKVVKAQRPFVGTCNKEEKEHEDFPAMIETTAAVHPGGSGGAILNSDGHMISLVTSNARHGGGTVIPYLNFSIPCAALEPVFKFSKDMKDLSILEDLDKPSEHLSSVWALVPPISPKPGPTLPAVLPLLPGDKSKDTKGSRFAKFIAERQELLTKTSHHPGNAEGGSAKFLPSKL